MAGQEMCSADTGISTQNCRFLSLSLRAVSQWRISLSPSLFLSFPLSFSLSLSLSLSPSLFLSCLGLIDTAVDTADIMITNMENQFCPKEGQVQGTRIKMEGGANVQGRANTQSKGGT